MADVSNNQVIRRPSALTRKKVLVLGWYNHGNIGDEAFRPSFFQLWPQAAFTFSASVPDDVNEAYDVVMVGGGSFMDSSVIGIDRIELPMAFIGCGAGRTIRASMREALDRAKVILLRDQHSFDNLPIELHAKASVVADLVWARPNWPEWQGASTNKVTVILSEHFAPRGDCPEWVAVSWSWFCRELAQVLDRLIAADFHVKFMPMSTTRAWDDRRAAAMVISRMVRAADAYWYYKRQVSEQELLQCMAESRVVIAQRLHGSIFATAIGCPVVPVFGHDKVKGFMGETGLNGVDYYALSATTIEASIKKAMAYGTALAAQPPEDRRQNQYLTEARERWHTASVVVARELSL